MANAITVLLQKTNDTRRDLGIAGRQRIAKRYRIGEIVRRYESLWSDLATSRGQHK